MLAIAHEDKSDIAIARNHAQDDRILSSLKLILNILGECFVRVRQVINKFWVEATLNANILLICMHQICK